MLSNLDNKDPINFITNFSSTELDHKIIEIYDLKPSGLIDTQIRQKFVKNRDFIEQMYRQEEEDLLLWKMHNEQIVKANAMKAKNNQMDLLNSGLLLKLGVQLEKSKEIEEGPCKHFHPCDREFNPAKDQEYFMKQYSYNILHQDYELRIMFKESNPSMKDFKLRSESKKLMEEIKEQDN